MTALTVYLLIYNGAQLLVWSIAFARIIAGLATLLPIFSDRVTSEQLFHHVYPYVLAGQSLAWMEVVHAASGIAGGSILTTVLQALGRYVILKWVIGTIPVAHSWITTIVLFAVWSLADIVRYLFYIFSLLKISSSSLRWCRYSLFIFLQPVGICAEWLIYLWTLHYIDDVQLFRVKLPNVWNFAFDFGVWNRIVLVIYFYFGPLLVKYMLKQRRSKLS